MNANIAWKIAVVLALVATSAVAADYYVAPNGNDANQGTPARPFATLEVARDAARASGAGSNRIVVLPGDYFLVKPLELDTHDNGLTLEAAADGKVTLYGGKRVTGWRPDGDKFWSVDLPGVKEGTWDFRTLIVNGRTAEHARMPETGTFLHRSKFDVASLPAMAGFWARQPTLQERTTMEYDPKDIPPTLDLRNAEVRVYHMWDESLVGVASNDLASHTLTFSGRTTMPVGAFGIQKYVVFNTREGMTRPGQWYLDRSAGRLFYWPLPGEDMAKIPAVAPVFERIIDIGGTSQAPVENVTLRRLAIQATTTPLKPAGFGGMHGYDGALRMECLRHCTIEKIEISNVAGLGIRAANLVDCQICDCDVHDIGAGGVNVNGSSTLVARNHIYRVGLYHPGAAALLAGHESRDAEEKGLRVYRNEIHDVPYCGIIGGGVGQRIEENLVYRVMREAQDGAAIYGNLRHSTVSGNVVRDVVKIGEGFGVSAYYLDEGSRDTVIEHNVSIGIERPTHNHMASNIILRNNVFVAPTNLTLSFQRSSGCIFSGNMVIASGKITINSPNAVKIWTNNVVIHDGLGETGTPQPFMIDDAMPSMPPPTRRSTPVAVVRAPKPPVLDGQIGHEEWPGNRLPIEREPSRWSAGGPPVLANISYDNDCLYVAVDTSLFDPAKLSKGSVWGHDDGAEICIAGEQNTFVVRGFANGTLDSVTNAGASADSAARLGQAVHFAAKPYGAGQGDRKKGWCGEWAIPFDVLGLKPKPGLIVAFNLAVYRAEDDTTLCLEGTRAENWRLDEAATVQFK